MSGVAQHRNLVDAAIAEGAFHDLDREIYWSGPVRGWRQKANVAVGTLVKKTGRTTNFTVGRITAINATVDVGYGAGRIARFVDQMITTNLSAGGDSGATAAPTGGHYNRRRTPPAFVNADEPIIIVKRVRELLETDRVLLLEYDEYGKGVSSYIVAIEPKNLLALEAGLPKHEYASQK